MNSEVVEEVVVPGITATYIGSDGWRFPISVRFNVAEMSDGATFTVYKRNGQLRLEAGSMATDWKENQTMLPIKIRTNMADKYQ